MIQQWTLAHAILMLVSTTLAVIYDGLLLPAVICLASIGTYIALNRNVWMTLKPIGGIANIITLTRLILLSLAFALANRITGTPFVAMIVLVMIADGVDGYYARKLNQSTKFGATFDMEVDAFLALGLSFMIWKAHPDVLWVLVAGMLRYIFVILYRCLGWHKRNAPAMPEAKVIAVAFFISLLIPFVAPWPFSLWCVLLGCILVTFSFFREFYLIWRKG